MPRNGSGVFSLPAVYVATTGNTITAIQHNSPLTDIAADLNAARPVTCGGTGATTAADARDNLGLTIGSDVASAAHGVPTGAGMDFFGTVAPTGWIFAYGQNVSRTTYANLFAVLGTTHGEGDGSTTFGIPDKRGRASFGKDDMGGTAADRLTNQTGGIDGATLGATGGSETHTLTDSELPAHTHDDGTLVAAAAGAHSHTLSYDTTAVGDGGTGSGVSTGGTPLSTISTSTQPNHTHTVTGNTGSTGSDDAHNNLPPGIVCNYILKT